mgnify:CR=1 FL=1
MTPIGTAAHPLRVAIIGSGPSGFYAAEYLQRQPELAVEIDMFERLPTPFGLVRGGVAPDHPKIKSVTKVYDRIASHPAMRFYGNVTFGTDITRDDLVRHYHAIIYAIGAQTDRKLGIPGEELPGSHSATEFVAWYNAHPEFRDRKFNFSHESAAVIGVGNVAIDVARILLRSPQELYETDIADYALDALARSNVKRVYLLGRRGPAQAAFASGAVKELGELANVDVVVAPEEVTLDPLSEAYIKSGAANEAAKNVETLVGYATRPLAHRDRQIIIRFLVSPVEIIGTDRVEAIKIVKNELYETYDGAVRPRPTGEYEFIPVGLVFRSVGYRGEPLPEVPFNDKWGTIPNDRGRVLTEHGTGKQLIGEYVVGWIKRGPSGVIGTNRPDAAETVEMLLADLGAGKVLHPPESSRASVEALLVDRGVNYVSYEDWLLLDQLEQDLGARIGRPRLKFSRVEDMLEALEELRRPAGAGD